MEANGSLGRVKVKADGKATDFNGHFFSLEDHGLVEIVGPREKEYPAA